MNLFRINVALLLCLFALLVSCGTPRLEEGGAYHTGTNSVAQAADLTFFNVERTFDVTYSIIDGTFKWEEDNRVALFKLSPSIKHEMDKIRPKALAARNAYIKSRDAYMKNPTPEGMSELQTALSQVQRLKDAVEVLNPNPNGNQQ